MKKAIGLIALLCASSANAALIDLDWTTTASQFTGSVPGVVGEQITTTITVDNGGSSILSQSWDTSDFVSYRIEGASGWWIESDTLSSGSNLFSTDALGNVVTAGTWFGGYPTATITTSWAGVLSGGWWNNGNNQVVCSDALDCVWANNVNENLLGSSWTASVVTEVPEPTSMILLGLGLAGLGYSGKKKAA